MKHILLIVSLVGCLAINVSAQQDLKPLASVSTFQERLKNETTRIYTIESNFTQEKYLDVFEEKVISQGQFFYKREDKIRMEYSKPLSYLIIISGQKLKIVSEGKSNTISLGSNPMMNEIKSMLSACMVGDLNSLSSSYQPDYFENASLYVIRIKPVSKSVQAYIREIVVSIDKKDMSVKALRLWETEKDYTEYIFTHKKYNTIVSDELFAIP
ncbi:MAG: outer membrane lipoprotein carrier protein LolA [Tannerellaceae bacterium]|jgi:outer membrane lipoprotein-sorting protein|nr:outer membrane lipoprotein carrier protein LolA [Tannerellaceae bacterium]